MCFKHPYSLVGLQQDNKMFTYAVLYGLAIGTSQLLRRYRIIITNRDLVAINS